MSDATGRSCLRQSKTGFRVSSFESRVKNRAARELALRAPLSQGAREDELETRNSKLETSHSDLRRIRLWRFGAVAHPATAPGCPDPVGYGQRACRQSGQ